MADRYDYGGGSRWQGDEDEYAFDYDERKRIAEDVAESVSGVRDVRNALQIQEERQGADQQGRTQEQGEAQQQSRCRREKQES